MPEALNTLEIRGAETRIVDLEASAGVLPPQAWARSRNVMWRDDGTPTKRHGFHTHHDSFDSHAILTSESPASYAVTGLYEHECVRNTGASFKLLLAKVGDFLVGSFFGKNWGVPLAKGLGDQNVYPSFTSFNRDDDGLNYLIVMSSAPTFEPSFWRGTHAKWSSGAGEVPKWGFLERIEELPDGHFAVEHNRRLYVASADGFTIFYSAAGDPLNFVQGGQIRVRRDFGKLTGFFRTYYGSLIVGQTRAISRVEFDGFGLPSSFTPISTEVGLVNHRCTAQVGSDLIFLGTRGRLQTVGTTERFGDLLVGALGAEVKRRFESMPESAWPAAFLVDDPEERILWVGHSMGSGLRNDSLTGWDYEAGKWIVVENDSVMPMACAAVLRTARWQKPKVHFGSYDIVSTVGGFGTAGRLWVFNRAHKEDVHVFGSPEVTDSTTPNHLKPRTIVPRNGGMPVTIAQVNATGLYQNAVALRATVAVRALAAGTVGVGSLPLELDDRGAGQRGTILTDVGATYVPGTQFDVATATYDSGFNMQLPAVTLKKFQEIQLITDAGRKKTYLMTGGLFDVQYGIRFAKKTAFVARNFLSFLETAGLYIGDPHRARRILGLTIITKVSGNRADILTDDPDVHTDQNQYRWSLNVYFRADEDEEWSEIALLDGNAAKKPHISESLSEAAGDYAERPNLKYVVSPDGTETNGTAIAKDSDVNVEFVPVERSCKVFWLRLGQETACSLDHGVSYNDLESSRLGDWTVLAVYVHYQEGPGSAEDMSHGSSTILSDLPAVN